MNLSSLKNFATSRAGLLAGTAAVVGAATACWVEYKARRAEREHPPTGRIIDIDGVHLHYVERGEGPPVVLLHGNIVSLPDFEACGLIDRLALTHRVIAFDRPGFGHSTRPRDRLWTPSAQGKLLHAALGRLGIERPVIVGHSMGAMVAMAMALDYPHDVSGLVLLGGYYYPTARIDALLTAPVALPVVGDVMRYTVTAVSARLAMKPMVEAAFAPRDLPGDFFSVLVREMMLRPVQIRAAAEDAVFMILQAKASSKRHRELRMPVAIFAGAKDLVIDVDAHSTRLHRDVPHSELIVAPGTGHMVHYAVPEAVVAAIGRQSVDTGVPAETVLAPVAAGALDGFVPRPAPLERAA